MARFAVVLAGACLLLAVGAQASLGGRRGLSATALAIGSVTAGNGSSAVVDNTVTAIGDGFASGDVNVVANNGSNIYVKNNVTSSNGNYTTIENQYDPATGSSITIKNKANTAYDPQSLADTLAKLYGTVNARRKPTVSGATGATNTFTFNLDAFAKNFGL